MKRFACVLAGLAVLWATMVSIDITKPLLAQVQSNTARHIIYGGTLPSSCNPNTGDVFFKTAATKGGYECLTANTWTRFGSGGAGPSGPSGPSGATGATGPSGPSGTASPWVTATVQITAAQIKALDTVDKQLVAAQGAGTIVIVDNVAVEYVFGTTAFACTSADLRVKSGTDSYFVGGNLAFQLVNAADNFLMIPVIATIFTGDTPVFNTGVNTAILASLGAGNCHSQGAIGTNAVNNGGLGYLNTETGEIDGACYISGPKSTYTVTSAPGTIVATYTVTNNGGLYVTGTGCTTTATSGVGTGLTIDVSTVIPPGDGSLWVTTVYRVQTAH